MMRISEIVFIQGEDAEEALSLLDEDIKLCLHYLRQWETGEEHTCIVENIGGLSDHIFQERSADGGLYIINVNFGVPYIGLSKILEEGEDIVAH